MGTRTTGSPTTYKKWVNPLIRFIYRMCIFNSNILCFFRGLGPAEGSLDLVSDLYYKYLYYGISLF